MTRSALAAALLCGAAACIPENGPLMEPGSDCMECHDGGEAKRWTVAGTWPDGQGSRVFIRDRAGKSLTMKTNRAGNFYTAEPLAFPLATVGVDGAEMPRTAQTQQGFTQGSCGLAAGCHGFGSHEH